MDTFRGGGFKRRACDDDCLHQGGHVGIQTKTKKSIQKQTKLKRDSY